MPEAVSAAALTRPAASAAPAPSPWPTPRSSSGRKPSRSAARACAGSGDRLASRQWSSAVASAACSAAAAAVATNPSSRTGIFCVRAARMAPAIAANSRPPTRRNASSGSLRPVPWKASAASTTSALRTRIDASAPDPDPTQSAPLPPNSAANKAAATVELPTPRSPRQSRSVPPAIASMPKAMVAAQPRSSSAASSVMSAVGMCSARSNTFSPRSLAMQIWLIAAPPAAQSSTAFAVAATGRGEMPWRATP